MGAMVHGSQQYATSYGPAVGTRRARAGSDTVSAVTTPPSNRATADVFVLTRSWRDRPNGLELTYWGASERGPVCVVITNAEAVCFVKRADALPELRRPPRRRAVELWTMSGEAVDALYFQKQRELQDARTAMRDAGVQPYESTVRPVDRYLMERFITAGAHIEGEAEEADGVLRFVNPRLSPIETAPELRWLSLDIETEGFDGPVLSISATRGALRRAFIVEQPAWPVGWRDAAELQATDVSTHPDERALLAAFFEFVRSDDPDLLIGWKVIGFDLVRLQERAEALRLPFDIGRGGALSRVLLPQSKGQPPIARVPGRAVLDGIDMLKAATWRFDRFSLEHVSQALLGVGKTVTTDGADKVAELLRLWREDPAGLLVYNIQDCVLVERVFEAADLRAFAMQRSRLTGLAIDRRGGSTAAFDNLYLPRLHRRGRVALDVEDTGASKHSPGGFVLDAEAGLYGTVLVLDFKSLYPSIIRTFLIDPLGLVEPGDDPVPGFLGAEFGRNAPILPALITELWAARDKAKAESNTPLSTAIKIIMNSFYGVLGSFGCRFHDPRLASSITLRGHELLNRTRQWLEAERGLKVIYGDTDSLFVSLSGAAGHEESMQIGRGLARDINVWWAQTVRDEVGCESHLEIEFETCFEQFFMPTMRGSEVGTKKRYVGWERTDDGEHSLTVKGMEAVRSDSTAWIKRLQLVVFRRLFEGAKAGELRALIAANIKALRAGDLDDELVVSRRLRRSLSEYQGRMPPHARAAAMLERPGRNIEFLWTTAGPQPTSVCTAPIDHELYIDRHLAPALDGVLKHLGIRVGDVADRQLSLF